MDRRDLLCRGAAAGTLALAGCLGGDDPAFTDGFESGLDGWEPAAAIGPEVDLADFDWEVAVSDAQAASGDRSLRIWNEGDYDDGVTWATRPVSISTDGTSRINVTAQFWSESESFNTLRDAVMRLGPERPAAEADFPDPGLNTSALRETPYGGLREPLWLADGWREYTFEWTLPALSTDQLYLSVGTSVIWEGDAEHYVDEVAVETHSS
ncbi:hypothetical protein [Halobellus rubicundus]|uniref:Twin-arginine translocation signal domain-containing protein n=1 Tax=Halobellus rubicundus TaxID=2996466 RepID=A0ABD5MM80_9EURY